MTKTNTRSRIVSILLVLVMLLTMVPITAVTVNAAEWTTVNSYEQFEAAMTAEGQRSIKLGSDIDTGTAAQPKPDAYSASRAATPMFSSMCGKTASSR